MSSFSPKTYPCAIVFKLSKSVSQISHIIKKANKMGITIVIIEELTDVFYNIYKAAGLGFVNYLFVVLCRLHEVNICNAFMN